MPSLIDARFVGRPNRFVVRARLEDGTLADAHLGDPGRLRDLLTPGAKLRLRPVPADVPRKTRYTVVLVRSGAPRPVWVGLETARANRLAERLFAAGALDGHGPEWSVRREVAHEGSRFDFRLTRGSRTCWVEVKSVTWVEAGRGLFPDAPTARGLRHVEALTELAGKPGTEALVLFVVQRADAGEVRPSAAVDPALATALARADRAGVRLRAAVYRLDRNGRAALARTVPVIVAERSAANARAGC